MTHEQQIDVFIPQAQAFAQGIAPHWRGNEVERIRWNLAFHLKMIDLTIKAGLRIKLKQK